MVLPPDTTKGRLRSRWPYQSAYLVIPHFSTILGLILNFLGNDYKISRRSFYYVST
jgi:hypothetical protein